MNDFSIPTYYDAVAELVGNGNLTGGLTDGPMSGIGFADGVTKPTESVVQAKLTELISAYDALAYSRNRASAYDSIGNQLDMIYKDNLNGTTTHKDSVEAVKAKYPKPE